MSERDAQFAEAAAQRDLMRSLIGHAGWKMLVENMEARVAEKTIKLDAPLESADKLYLQENTKGERRSLRFIMALPQAIIDQASAAIEAIETEAKENEDVEEGSSDDGDGDGDASDD